MRFGHVKLCLKLTRTSSCRVLRLNWTTPNCSIPPSVQSHIAPPVFTARSCSALVENNEDKLNVSYSFIVRVRLDYLWEEPILDPAFWPKEQILAPYGALDDFAVVPRLLARSYFSSSQLLQHDGCRVLRSGMHTHFITRSTHCGMVNTPAACLFQLKLMIDGVSSTQTACNRQVLRAPRRAVVCTAQAAKNLTAKLRHPNHVCV